MGKLSDSVSVFFNEEIPNGQLHFGFDPIHNKPIFETFTRLHSRDEYDGTGLGLSLCRKIVELHNGSIEAHGEKNVGAMFLVNLPLRQVAQSIRRL